MIKELPCGCKTKPIDKNDNFEEYLSNKIAVWFDDPRCEDHENGTDTVGFMMYKDDQVVSHLTRDGRLKIDKYNLTDAIETLKKLKRIGYDFSLAKMEMEQDSDGSYTMICRQHTAS